MSVHGVWQGFLYLVACRTAWFQSLGVMSPAVDFALVVEVNEVHQELVTRAAHEAPRVPAHAVPRPRRKNGDVASVNLTAALRERRNMNMECDTTSVNVSESSTRLLRYMTWAVYEQIFKPYKYHRYCSPVRNKTLGACRYRKIINRRVVMSPYD